MFNSERTESVLNKGAEKIALLFNPPPVLSLEIIAGIANNINQAVKLGNSQGKLYYSDIDKLQNSLDYVKKTFGEVLEVWRLQRS